MLNHCTLGVNSAERYGGGASWGTLYNCTLTGNTAEYGGGASESTLYNCVLTRNSAGSGGGAAFGTLSDCILTGNAAVQYGGGASKGTLNNCTLTGNSAMESGGGVAGSTLNNCLVHFNTAPNGPNWSADDQASLPSFAFACTAPLPPGPGNIALDPLFMNAAGGDFRLRPDSSCINAGSNEFVSGETDVAGNPRIFGGKVDIGAYEYQFDPSVPIFTATSLTPEGLGIEWQATAIGATLQRSATLNPPAWQDVPGSETVTSVTVPVTQAQEFFQLVKR